MALAAIIVLCMGSALNAKALGASIIAGIGVYMVNTDDTKVWMVLGGWVLSLVLAGFGRD